MQITDKDPRLTKVEHLRKKMTEIALKKGLASAESVRISQELDILLNEIQENRSND